MSSATIPDNMTMSCTSVLDRMGEDGQETEKEVLLRRLKELTEQEGKQVPPTSCGGSRTCFQVKTDLTARRRQLQEVEEHRTAHLARLQEAHRKEEQEVGSPSCDVLLVISLSLTSTIFLQLLARQDAEKKAQIEKHREEEDRIGGEIGKLEEELERLQAPSQLLSSLSTCSPVPPPPSSTEVNILSLNPPDYCSLTLRLDSLS